MFKNNNSTNSNEVRKSNISIPILSDAAKRLLKTMSLDPHGQVLYLRSFSGTSIQSNRTEFCSSQENREIAKWNGAIENLLNENLINRTGAKNEIFTINDLGYQVADTIELPLHGELFR